MSYCVQGQLTELIYKQQAVAMELGTMKKQNLKLNHTGLIQL